MKLTQVKGKTFVLEGYSLIPLYRVEETRCILLDTGLPEEREELEAALVAAGLTPAGILGTHTHLDHSANHRYFQEKYHIPVAMPAGEAALCRDILHLKSYLFMFSPEETRKWVGDMVVRADVLIGPEDEDVELCGTAFRVIHTPGHSPDHISVITPDGVCYVGDALLSGGDLQAKLPYSLSLQADLESRERLRGLSCGAYILAHRGIFNQIDELIDANREMLQGRAAEIAGLIDRPMTMDEIYAAVCRRFELFTSKAFKAAVYERNLRSFVEYLLDRGDLETTVIDGIRRFGPAAKQHK